MFWNTNDCLILGIDPGKRSGASAMYREKLLGTAKVADKPEQRDAWVQRCVRFAIARGIVVMPVIEKWSAGGTNWGPKVVQGLSANKGKWLDALERGGVPKSRVVSVYTQTWRSQVLGRGSGKAEELESLARFYVENRFELEANSLSDDEIEAVGIACWGSRSDEVKAKMPTRVRKGKP